ncbi:MAG: hypothetical protein WC217_01495 [Candidatus Paceibacterota bacterium]|jgi:hypothetical protein
MFFAFLLVLLPNPRAYRTIFGVNVLTGRYFKFYDGCEKKALAWHRAEHKRLDPMFSLSLEVLGYADAQIEAEAKGIKPFAPDYPKLDLGIVWAYPQERVDAVTRACASALKKEGPSGSGTATP